MKNNSSFRGITFVRCARINAGTCRPMRVARQRNCAFQTWGKLVTAMHRTLTLGLAASSLTILLALLTGCQGLGQGTPPGTFSVTAIVPAAGANCVDATADIQITFSAAPNPTTVNSTNIQVTGQNSGTVAGTLTYNSTSYTATFTPLAALTSNETFTVTVTSVVSSSGVGLQTPFTSTFTTGPCGATTQYQASLFTAQADAMGRQIVINSVYGQISVDSNGTVTVQLTGATPSTTFTVQFCPAPSQNYSCFNVGSVSSDTNGNANTTMTFPTSGSWAGDFELASGGTAVYQTDVVSGGGSLVYMSTLQPASTVNGQGLGVGQPPQDPLQTGSVTFSNGSLQFQMTGASPHTTYSSAECALNLGSSCYELYSSQGGGGFTTDGGGNVTFSVFQDGSGGDIFEVNPPTGSGFVGGFMVSSGG